MIDAADILLIGLGGLGCPIVAGLGATQPAMNWVIADGDVVDPSNLARQYMYDKSHVGMRKTTVCESFLHAQGQRVVTIGSVRPADLPVLLSRAKVVIEASDDVELKFAVNDEAVKQGVPVVIGGVTGLDGFVLSAQAEQACLRCVFEGPTEEMRRTCAEAGVLAPAPTMVGALMAHAAEQLMRGDPGAFWSLSLKVGRSRELRFQRAAHCQAPHHHSR